jgi:hypothetical protein
MVISKVVFSGSHFIITSTQFGPTRIQLLFLFVRSSGLIKNGKCAQRIANARISRTTTNGVALSDI